MNDVFPLISTVSIKETEAGSVVKIPRLDNPLLALVTDDVMNNARSIVWLNAKMPDRPSVIFAENWRNEEAVLRYNGNIRFDLGMADNEIDARGGKFWETPGVMVSIGDDLYIRAAPLDNFYGSYKLVNIRTGSVFPKHPPSNLWSFLSWRLYLRDSVTDREITLMQFNIKQA
jgi:hypothetical protein